MCEVIDVGSAQDIVSAHLELIGVSHAVLGVSSYFVRGSLTPARRLGYALVDSTGRVSTFGGVDHHGEAHTSFVTHIRRDPVGAGNPSAGSS